LEKVDEVAGALLKKLADKTETKKALIYLEKKVNCIDEMTIVSLARFMATLCPKSSKRKRWMMV